MARPRTPLSPGPSRRSTAEPPEPRRRRSQPWAWLALLVGITCCAGDSGEVGNLQAGTRTERARIFLIEMEDGGVDGPRVSCGDSAVPVEVALPVAGPALEGSLKELLAKTDRFDTRTGLYHALHASRLTLERVERAGPVARIHLKGYLEITGDCDDERVLAQLTETARQFPDVREPQFFLEGKPLQSLLSGK